MSADAKKKYQLVIRIEYSAMDDAEARMKAGTDLLDIEDVIGVEMLKQVKLQEMNENAPPRKVEL